MEAFGRDYRLDIRQPVREAVRLNLPQGISL